MRDFQGPCLCGDPYCPHCGDPSRAEYEALGDEFLELINDLTVEEAKAVMHMAKTFKENIKVITPLLSAGIMENINETVKQAHERLSDVMADEQDGDPSTEEGF